MTSSVTPDQDERDGPREEGRRIAGSPDERAAEVHIRHIAQDDAEDHRRGRIVVLPHGIPEEAESQHHPDVEDPNADREGPDDAQDKDDRHEDGTRDHEDFDQDPHQRESQHQHGQGGQDEHCRDFPDVVRELDHEERAGPNPVQPHGAEQHRGGRAPRNGERKYRDNGPADAGVVSRLGRYQTLARPFAELLRLLAAPFGEVVGNPGGDVLAHTGDSPDDDADDSRTEDCPAIEPKIPPPRQDFLDLGRHPRDHGLPHDAQDLGDAVDADQDRDQGEAAPHLVEAE